MRLRRSTRQVGEDEAIPASLPAFFGNATVGGGPAPVRAYIEELLPDVLEGRIEPIPAEKPQSRDGKGAGVCRAEICQLIRWLCHFYGRQHGTCI